MTWKELKDVCNSLQESELEKKVILWREFSEDVIIDISFKRLDEDYYIQVVNSESGCFPVSACTNLEPETKIKRVYKKWQPVLAENF